LLPTSKRSTDETLHTTDPGATLSDSSFVENGTAVQGDRLHCGGSPVHHQPRGPAESRLPGLSPPTSPPVDADPAIHQNPSAHSDGHLAPGRAPAPGTVESRADQWLVAHEPGACGES